MEIRLVAVGRRMPGWIGEGVHEFLRRMPPQLPVRLVEVDASRARQGGDIERARRDEAEALLAAAGDAELIALDERGRGVSTRQVAQAMEQWMMDGRDVALLIGGADGLDERCRERARRVWSLSALTFPHQLVRIIVAEQLYRAWTLLNHHPYHRE
jgi:23S rRNA (pseudouridine1915-N3)-methyltransferase